MPSVLQIVTSVINIVAFIILICNAFGFWIISSYFGGGAAAIAGVYCLAFGVFLFSFEFKDVEHFYNKYFLFFTYPAGRGSLYILFSLVTFNYIWYGIVSFVLLIASGIALVIIHFSVAEFQHTSLIPNFNQNIQSQEKDTPPLESVHTQPTSMPEPTVPN